MENKFSVEYKIRSTLWSEKKGRMGNLIDRMSWFWLVRLKKYYQLSLFFIFTLLSMILVLAEISIFTHIDLNVLGHILRADYGFINT